MPGAGFNHCFFFFHVNLHSIFSRCVINFHQHPRQGFPVQAAINAWSSANLRLFSASIDNPLFAVSTTSFTIISTYTLNNIGNNERASVICSGFDLPFLHNITTISVLNEDLLFVTPIDSLR